MSYPLPSRRFSPWTFVLVLVGLVITSSWLLPQSGRSQVSGAMTSNVALNSMLAKLKTQQDQMAANQTKIEAQTAQLEETLRQAKIYSARSGSGHR